MYIASNTNSSVDHHRLDYVILELTPELAQKLLKYREVLEAAKKIDDNLLCVEYFNYLATFGVSNFEIGDDWVRVPNEDAVIEDKDFGGVEAPTMKINDGGIIWAASPKNGNGEIIESEELDWVQIEAVARGEDPFDEVSE